MISAFAFVVAALATARLTRLLTSDYVTATPRAWLIQRWGTSSKLSYLIACDWCSSMWVGAIVAPLAYFWGHSWWFLIPATALAFSCITGVLSNLLDGE